MKRSFFIIAILAAGYLTFDRLPGFSTLFAQSTNQATRNPANAGLAVRPTQNNQPTAPQQQRQNDRALAASIRQLTNRSAAGLVEERLPDGGVMLDLQGRFQNLPLAIVDGNGDLTTGCVDNLEGANRFFGRNLETGEQYPVPPRPPVERTDPAVRLGLSQREYQFYQRLIEEAQLRRRLSPTLASITIVNNDGAGEGFNDAAARAPEGGNNGATLGEQRLNLFNQAAAIWGAFLDSSVPTSVRANFNPLTPCTSSGGVLGSAGTINISRDFTNAPFAGTWYHAALSNKLRGSDSSANPEITATFNSDVDTGCLGAGTRFYYGFDGATPSGTVNLLVVLLHELGHGLGFSSFVTGSTGQLNSGFPDIYTRFMFDRSTNKYWYQMTNAERAASALNTHNVLWDGLSVRLGSSALTAGRDAATGRVQLYTPNPLQSGSSISHWDTAALPNLLMEPSINKSLPLDLDMSRQQMRDIGWYRDSTADLVADTIISVQPNSGTLVIGSNVNITWTNTGGFNRNVTIELSTDGGATFPITIATDVSNTGTRAFSVPNNPTAQARLRVREHNFAEPAGVSSANFTITASGNTAPEFAPAAALSRQQGSPAGPAVTVGTVSDIQTSAGSLTVTQIAGGTASGITVSGSTNTDGTITAQVSASCTATSGTVRFQVSDGSLIGTGDLQVNVSANTPPTLTYANAGVLGGGSTGNSPATATDNGSIASYAVQSQGTYTGTISVNSSGLVSISNAAPAGAHTITIRATDNCGATTAAQFTLTVNAPLVITSVTPPAGRASGGQQIKLAGSFVNLATVTMGGVLAPSWFFSSGTSEITVTTPAHAVGAVNIDLTPSAGSAYTKTNAFAYLPTIFTDDPLVVGVTTAKAQHIIELRQAVDALRTVAGLTAAAWTDATLVPGITFIKATHIAELRSNLEAAALALGYGTTTYTDPALSSGLPIKRVHIEELRQRIRVIAG